MIIDARTHVWSGLDQLGPEVAAAVRARGSHRGSALETPLAAHDAAMTCVNAALVFGFRSQRLDAHVPNELIAEFVARDPQRRIGVSGIDPLAEGALDHLEAAAALGLAAATVSPPCQSFHPAHSAAMRVYERCAELQMPLIVAHLEPLTRSAIMEFGRPGLWDEVAQAFPNLPIVISQLGAPWIDETLVLLGKHRNVFADVSGVVSRPWQLYGALLSATSLGVMNKLLFASGFPFEQPSKAIEALYSVNAYSHGTQLPSVPRSLLRGIVERDSLGCLGVEHDALEAVVDTQEAAAVEVPDLSLRRERSRL